jgi:hypothetical protein
VLPVNEMTWPARGNDHGHRANRGTGVAHFRLHSDGHVETTCVYIQYGEKREIFQMISLFFDPPSLRNGGSESGTPAVREGREAARGAGITGGSIRPMLR